MALEEALALDIQEALNSVGQLETALTSAASLFASSLAEALTVLDSLQVGTVDASAVTTDIDAAVAAADLAPVVTADAGAVTTDIDAAVAAVDALVTPSTDAGAITTDIDAAVASADATIRPSVDTAAVTQEIDSAVGAVDASITVSADTAEAQSAVSSLGGEASTASGGVEQLKGAAEGLTTAAALGKGEVGALGEVAGGLSGAAGAAGIGVAALTGFTAELFHVAAEGQVAENKFASSLGDVAERVKTVNIGGLNEDLIGLATRTGNAKDQLLLADAKIGDLGHSAGATDDQIASLAEQINVVAIRATTLNPNLGQAGDVADRLAGAFARGGRALIPFGIALTSTEINARALQDTGKSTATELTLFEKSAAGAAITTERLGQHLGSDINQGAKSAEVQIRSLKEEFHLALEELGKPLLDPLVRALREGEPLLLQIGKELGELAQAVLPLFAKGIEAIGPLVGGASAGFEVLIAAVKPLVDLLVAIPTPVLTAVAAFFALGPVLEAAATGLLAVRIALLSLSEGGLAGLGASISAAISPMTLLAAGGAVLVGVLLSQANSAKSAKEANDAYRGSLLDVARAVDDVVGSKVAASFKDQSDAILKAGTSVETLTKQVSAGRPGYNEFLDDLVRTGTISRVAGEALKHTDLNIVEFATSAQNAVLGSDRLSGSAVKLVGSFQATARATQDQAKAAVAEFAAQSASNNAAVEGARDRHKLADGTTDYLGVLKQVKPPLDAEKTAQDAAGTAAGKHAAQLKTVNDEMTKFIDIALGAFDAGIKLSRAHLAVNDAARSLHDAEKAATDATTAHGAASDEAKVAQDKLRSAELDVQDSALKLAAAHNEADEKARGLAAGTLDADAKQRNLRAAVDEVAGSLSPGSPVMAGLQDLVNHLGQIHPVDFSVFIHTGDAQANVNNLITSLDTLNRTAVSSALSGSVVPGGRMAGGPVGAGEAVIVGEREPELFVPNVSGFILNQSQIRAIVAASQPPPPVPTHSVSPPVVQHVTVNEVAHDVRATAFAVSSRIGQGARR